MVFQDLKNVFTDILPGLSLPAGAACFVIARVDWIRQGEVNAFDVEAPSPWNFDDLCTFAFFVANHETDAARLMVANLLLPSATLLNQNDNYIKQRPFRRRKQTRRQRASSGLEIDVELQVMISFCCIYRVFFFNWCPPKNYKFFSASKLTLRTFLMGFTM